MKSNFFKAILIGIVAGIIDVIPMLLQNISYSSCISAFVHWVVLASIIPFVNWEINSILKGSIIGVISSLPTIILIINTEPESIIPILISSLLLGSLVAYIGSKWIKL